MTIAKIGYLCLFDYNHSNEYVLVELNTRANLVTVGS